MSTFNTIKNKIQKIFFNNNESLNNLQKKENEIRKLFNDKQIIKKIQNLYDSGWIAKKPSIPSIYTRATKGALTSEIINTYDEIDLDLPEIFLPFIKVSTLVKPTPQREAKGYIVHDIEYYQNDYVEVYGDSNLIWKGDPRSLTARYSTSELNNNQFQRSYAKKVYNTTIIYNDGLTRYRIIGQLFAIQMIKNLGINCQNIQDQEIYDGFFVTPTPPTLPTEPLHDPLDLISLEANFIGKKTIRTWTDDGFGGCTGNDAITNNTTIARTYSENDKNIWQISGTRTQWNGTNWVNPAFNTWLISDNAYTIESKEFTFQGYELFYSSNKLFRFGIGNVLPLISEGSKYKIELKNLPISPNRPYIQINFIRNPENYPEPTVSEISRIGSKQQFVLKKNSNINNIQSYKLIVWNTIPISTSADKLSSNSLQFPVYNDIYTQSGTSYIVNENHTLKLMEIYESERNDIQVRIKVDIINPFYSEEEKQYQVIENEI